MVSIICAVAADGSSLAVAAYVLLMYIVNKNDKLNKCKNMLFSDPIFKEQKSS